MYQYKSKKLNQTKAIQHFIEKMDIEMVNSILDSDKTYQNFEKYLFISKLQQAFESFSKNGDTHLIAVEGTCNYCDKSKTGFTFIGNNSNNYMSIILDTIDDKIKDLYECGDFKNQETRINLKERIYIDNKVAPRTISNALWADILAKLQTLNNKKSIQENSLPTADTNGKSSEPIVY